MALLPLLALHALHSLPPCHPCLTGCHADFSWPSSGHALPPEVFQLPSAHRIRSWSQLGKIFLPPSVPADPAALPPSLPAAPLALLAFPHIPPVLRALQDSSCSRECLCFLLHDRPLKLYPSTETSSIFQVPFSLLSAGCKLNIVTTFLCICLMAWLLVCKSYLYRLEAPWKAGQISLIYLCLSCDTLLGVLGALCCILAASDFLFLPQRAGYSLQELFHLTRSQVSQQRALALHVLAQVISRVSRLTAWSCPPYPSPHSLRLPHLLPFSLWLTSQLCAFNNLGSQGGKQRIRAKTPDNFSIFSKVLSSSPRPRLVSLGTG